MKLIQSRQTYINIRITPSIKAAIFVAPFLAVVIALRADVITVTNTNDSGPGSLRQALSIVNDGETIDFAVTGTITLTSGELLVNDSISISGPGATNLAVNGNQARDPGFTPLPLYDQRGPGYPRVVNGRIDKGSFEVQGPTPSPTSTPSVTPTSTPTPTPTPCTGRCSPTPRPRPTPAPRP